MQSEDKPVSSVASLIKCGLIRGDTPISFDEFVLVLPRHTTDQHHIAELQELYNRAALNSDSRLTLDQFFVWSLKRCGGVALETALSHYDEDGTGRLDEHAFGLALADVGFGAVTSQLWAQLPVKSQNDTVSYGEAFRPLQDSCSAAMLSASMKACLTALALDKRSIDARTEGRAQVHKTKSVDKADSEVQSTRQRPKGDMKRSTIGASPSRRLSWSDADELCSPRSPRSPPCSSSAISVLTRDQRRPPVPPATGGPEGSPSSARQLRSYESRYSPWVAEELAKQKQLPQRRHAQRTVHMPRPDVHRPAWTQPQPGARQQSKRWQAEAWPSPRATKGILGTVGILGCSRPGSWRMTPTAPVPRLSLATAPGSGAEFFLSTPSTPSQEYVWPAMLQSRRVLGAVGFVDCSAAEWAEVEGLAGMRGAATARELRRRGWRHRAVPRAIAFSTAIYDDLRGRAGSHTRTSRIAPEWQCVTVS